MLEPHLGPEDAKAEKQSRPPSADEHANRKMRIQKWLVTIAIFIIITVVFYGLNANQNPSELMAPPPAIETAPSK